jgi:cell division protein ZapA
MGQVNVTINGRQYRMACEDGQETHLRRLAESFDDRIRQFRGKFGEIGDARLTVMAAIAIADELSEMAHKVESLEQEIAALESMRAAGNDRAQATQTAIIAAFNAAAERIEKVTRGLNMPRSSLPLS